MGKNTQKAQKSQGSQKVQTPKDLQKVQNFQSLIDAYGINVEYAEDEARFFDLLHYLNNILFRGRGVIQAYDGPGGADPQNAGQSGVILAHFGHLIIHLFSQRRVAMIDYFSDLPENTRKANCNVITKAVRKYLGLDRYDQSQGRAGQSFGHSITFQTTYLNQSRMVAIADKILPRIGTKTPASENTILVKGSNYDLIYTLPHAHIVFHVNNSLDLTVASVFSRKPIQWDLWQNSLLMFGLTPQKITIVDRGAGVNE